MERAVILHEEKSYFPSTEDVFPDAETLVQDEDTVPLSRPVIEPTRKARFEVVEQKEPKTTFSPEYDYHSFV